MKRRSLVYIFPLAVLFVTGFYVKAMEVSASKEEPISIPIPKGTLQEREADFVLKGRDFTGRKTATLDKDGRIQVWDTTSGALLTTLRESYKNEGVRYLDFSFDGTRLIIDARTGITKVTVATTSELREKAEREIEKLAMEPRYTSESPGAGALEAKKADIVLKGREFSGRKTATLDKDGKIQVWDTSSGVLLKTLSENYKNEGVRYLDFSVNGDTLIIESPYVTTRVSAV